MSKITHISPEWTGTYAPASFERDFGLRYTGPGVYLTKTDTVVVTPLPPSECPTTESIWRKQQSRDVLLSCQVWNAPFDETILSVMAVAPTRHDGR
jgi:hypothetical protein